MRGGRGMDSSYVPLAPLPAPVFPYIPEPIQLNINTVNAQIAAQNMRQLNAITQLAGGGKGKHGKQWQHGGSCGTSITSGANGYGYIAPTNCTLVPSVQDPLVQPSVTAAAQTLITNIANSVGDRAVYNK